MPHRPHLSVHPAFFICPARTCLCPMCPADFLSWAWMDAGDTVSLSPGPILASHSSSRATMHDRTHFSPLNSELFLGVVHLLRGIWLRVKITLLDVVSEQQREDWDLPAPSNSQNCLHLQPGPTHRSHISAPLPLLFSHPNPIAAGNKQTQSLLQYVTSWGSCFTSCTLILTSFLLRGTSLVTAHHLPTPLLCCHIQHGNCSS